MARKQTKQSKRAPSLGACGIPEAVWQLQTGDMLPIALRSTVGLLEEIAARLEVIELRTAKPRRRQASRAKTRRSKRQGPVRITCTVEP